MQNKRMIRFDLYPLHNEDLETVDHVRGFDVGDVPVEDPDAEVLVFVDPMLGRDGAVEAVERVLQTMRGDKAWEFIDEQLREGNE